MSTATFLRQLRDKGACSEGYAWARETKATGVDDAWVRLLRADWMLWVVENFGLALDVDLLRQFAFECADRAVHTHAVAALRSAGLAAEADRLDAVAPITDERSANAARDAARDAAWAAWAARDVSGAAWAASDAARDAAWAASAARAARAASAARDAAWAAWAASAARAAAWAARDVRAASAARDAAWVAAEAAEQLWEADRLRVIFPSVGPAGVAQATAGKGEA